MKVVTSEFHVTSKGNADMIDITGYIREAIEEHQFVEGSATVFVPGATGGVTTIEFEPGLREDFPKFFDKIAPENAVYKHDETWHDGNGHSHVRASLLGPSLTVPFSEAHLILGQWQQIVLVDFDNKPRERRVIVQLIGTGG